MIRLQIPRSPRFALVVAVFVALGMIAWPNPSRICAADIPAGKAEAALEKPVPASVKDLLAIQQQVQKMLPKAMACTVGVVMGRSSGSGVIINEEGYVLTAGHVAGRPGRTVTLILHDGRRIQGKTLGMNTGIDSGLIKITTPGKFPHAKMGKSNNLKRGQWCISLGHPNGYKKGRAPVVRVGRILSHNNRIIRTDCTLVGGDSGGPLFDLDGNVIGIHSRISGPLTVNIHVPVNSFRNTWERLAKGERWDDTRVARDAAYLGVEIDTESDGCVVSRVVPGEPADEAGFQVDDEILQFDDNRIRSFEDLRYHVTRKKADDEVKVVVKREGKLVTLKVKLGRR